MQSAEFYEETEKKGVNQRFAHYVWDVLIAMSKGYGFNQSHTLAYSLIGLQEMNLAFRFPIMFWNCACLISDAGGDDTDSGGDEEIEVGGTDSGSTYEMAEGIIDFVDEESEDDDDASEGDGEDSVIEGGNRAPSTTAGSNSESLASKYFTRNLSPIIKTSLINI